MHEASVVQELLDMVNAAVDRPGARITVIRLILGRATGYMEASMRFYLGILGKGTAAEGAELEIQYVSPVLRCPSCAREYEADGPSFLCPACASAGVLTGRGREFIVDSIEVSDGEESACASS